MSHRPLRLLARDLPRHGGSDHFKSYVQLQRSSCCVIDAAHAIKLTDGIAFCRPVAGYHQESFALEFSEQSKTADFTPLAS